MEIHLDCRAGWSRLAWGLRGQDPDRSVSPKTGDRLCGAVPTQSRRGASYCDVGYDFKTCPRPSEDEPLGVPFPGSTYAEHGHPNWVGHLVYRLRDRTRLVVYDFAKGGDTTEGVERQIEQEFLPNLAGQPPPPDGTRVWSADDTLFGECPACPRGRLQH